MTTEHQILIMQLSLLALTIVLVLWQQWMFSKSLNHQQNPFINKEKYKYERLHPTVKGAYDAINVALKHGQSRLRISLSEMPCKPDFINFYKSITYGHKIKHDYEHDQRTDREFMILHLDTYLGPKNQPLEHIHIVDKEDKYDSPPPLPAQKMASGFEFNSLNFLKKPSHPSTPGQVIQVDFKNRRVQR